MFSFHKPKVYRSSSGCCICRAKSSSSRFTDSKKYESDFLECFQLKEQRSGEVCNACVLLVKRWKKLPEGSQRNWRHVVDARAGPGTKSATKFKSKQKRKIKTKRPIEDMIVEENLDEDSKKDVAMMDAIREPSPSVLSDEINGGDSLSDLSVPPSPTPSEDVPMPSFPHRTRTMLKRLAPPPMPAISGFLDMDFWKREEVCCGIIFKGKNGEVVIDPRFFKPCHSNAGKLLMAEPPLSLVPTESIRVANLTATTVPVLPTVSPAVVTPTVITTTKANGASATTTPFSDTSSDSGYDESSNQGEVVTSSSSSSLLLGGASN